MDALASPHVLDDVLRFFTSGKFADFQLRCNGRHFNVHKVIICATSKYFEALCGGNFMESSKNYATLDDEEPAVVARVLQACYSGNYAGAEQECLLPSTINSDRATCSVPYPSGPPEISSIGCVLQAEIYAFADKYEMRNLRRLAISKFEARMKSKDLGAGEVLEATKVIYNNIPRNDDKLRKHVVYYAQTHMLEIQRLPRFQQLMANVDFAWDFGTKYGSRAHVFCTRCSEWTKISVACGCGFSGLCEASGACTKQD